RTELLRRSARRALAPWRWGLSAAPRGCGCPDNRGNGDCDTPGRWPWLFSYKEWPPVQDANEVFYTGSDFQVARSGRVSPISMTPAARTANPFSAAASWR